MLEGETFVFAGLSLRFRCKWRQAGVAAVFLQPLPVPGPLLRVEVTMASGRTRQVLGVASDGSSYLDKVWTTDKAGGFMLPLGAADADGMHTLRLELQRK
jgi:hypothetical protein